MGSSIGSGIEISSVGSSVVSSAGSSMVISVGCSIGR